ncbi:hypothetical protein Francci3_0202 [Frankia casuarinae]|uniref:Uncharacterized protein n=1 Tax=Frankia casuarinae (strain DSM 45818 / CECT 9043 / HFP020203 / CcI3) TaxID=106370 RepID=Q2JGK0_FRACC|nr:hypothetical protein Francci3_0202 [Frankia casuarinae]
MHPGADHHRLRADGARDRRGLGAGSDLACLPVFVFCLLLQRHIVGGVARRGSQSACRRPARPCSAGASAAARYVPRPSGPLPLAVRSCPR